MGLSECMQSGLLGIAPVLGLRTLATGTKSHKKDGLARPASWSGMDGVMGAHQDTTGEDQV